MNCSSYALRRYAHNNTMSRSLSTDVTASVCGGKETKDNANPFQVLNYILCWLHISGTLCCTCYCWAEKTHPTGLQFSFISSFGDFFNPLIVLACVGWSECSSGLCSIWEYGHLKSLLEDESFQ